MSERVRIKEGEFVMKGEAVRAAASKAWKPSGQAVTFSPYLIRRHREQLAEWVQANELDPADIPDHLPLRVEEGKGGPVIRYHAYVRDDDGHTQVDPIHSDDVVTTERTAPCTVPPPDLGGATRPEAEPSGEAST